MVGISTTTARGAPDLPLDGDGDTGSTDGIAKIDLDLNYLISSPLRAAPNLCRPSPASKKISKKIAEVLKPSARGGAVTEIYSKPSGVPPRRTGLTEWVEAGGGNVTINGGIVAGQRSWFRLDLAPSGI